VLSNAAKKAIQAISKLFELVFSVMSNLETVEESCKKTNEQSELEIRKESWLYDISWIIFVSEKSIR